MPLRAVGFYFIIPVFAMYSFSFDYVLPSDPVGGAVRKSVSQTRPIVWRTLSWPSTSFFLTTTTQPTMFASWHREPIATIITNISPAALYLKSSAMEQTAPKRSVFLRLVFSVLFTTGLASQQKLVRARANLVSFWATTAFLWNVLLMYDKQWLFKVVC